MSDPFDVTSAPVTEPESAVTGSYLAWRRLLDYDGSLYTLSYDLIPAAGGVTITITGTWDATDQEWQFTVSAATSALWVAGSYRWDLKVTRIADSEVVIISTGSIEIFASTDDRRTHAEVMVKKIESILSGRADSDVESYSIKSRSITKMSVKELTEWRDYYLSEVRRTGGSTSGVDMPKANTVRVRWV